MSNSSIEGQTATTGYLRSITDEDAEKQLRHPKLWSYIVRNPRGVIVSHGRCRSRKACERRAVEHASDYSDEPRILCGGDDRAWPLDGWRFLVWPPSEEPCYVNRPRTWALSDPQVSALLLGLDHKLDRSSMGWSYDDRVNWSDPVHIYSPATIQSLHKRGMLDANFSDMRLHRDGFAGAENLDGARHEHSPQVAKFQVWTSALGREALKRKGLLSDDEQLAYH